MATPKKLLALTALGGAAIAWSAIAVPVVSAASTETIRPTDLVAELSATRSAGHVAFLADGLHVWTDDATNQAKAAEYFAVEGSLPTGAAMEWYGTQPAPGIQVLFDADGIAGNDNDWNILVGESIYGDNWWLTSSSSELAKLADPSGAEDGGNGSAWFGTLAQWKAALPDATMYAGGFSLGSGVKGDGMIESITYDDTVYRFTKNAETPEAPVPTVANVTGRSTVVRGEDRVAIRLRSHAQPENTVLGEKLVWRVKVDGRTIAVVRQGFGDADKVLYRYTGKHTVQVVKNGTVVRDFVVR